MGNLWRCNAVVGGLLISGVMAGCVVGSEEPADEGPHLGQVHQQVGWDEEFNGRSIVGAVFEGEPYMTATATEYFSVSTTGDRGERSKYTETVTFTGGASLRPSPTSPGVVGLILSSGSVRLRIASARAEGAITHYALELQTGPGAFTLACDDAIPLAGRVDRTGAHLPSVPSDPRITWVCKDGAGFKCALFGYPAGTPASPLWGVHQACMQMVEADYCARGIANTRIGTSIQFYDNAGVYQVPDGAQLPIMTIADWPPNVEDYYFEAAFQPSHTRAVCNARARWPLITDSCVGAIPDCPETVDDLIDPAGAALFVASRYNQLRLDRWHTGEGNTMDRVATVRGYYNPGDDQVKPPWPGYVHEGTPDGMLLRIPPTSVPLDNLIEIALFRGSANDMFLARSDDPRFATSAFTNLGREGYVYKNSSDVLNPRALRLYRNPSTGDRIATTMAPSEVAAQGYGPDPAPSVGSNLIGYMAAFQ